MDRLAYGIRSAAQAASVTEQDLAQAIQDGNLRARKLNVEPLILRADLDRWLESLPDF